MLRASFNPQFRIVEYRGLGLMKTTNQNLQDTLGFLGSGLLHVSMILFVQVI
jgi:hypothetical protein